MGVVYLTRQPVLGREVAVKVMAPELARDPEFLERFRREGEAAARLRHPNIVGVFDFATRDGLSFIAMEYLGSRTLKDLLQEGGQQSKERSCQILDELLSALETAHAKGIVHRDIKPANIMVTDDGPVALTDFSVAYMKDATRLTQTGAVVGTPEYMAPEQFDGVWDARTDLYAAGIIFYELLTGFSPFRSATMTEVMRKQLLTVPDPPSVVDFTIPEGLSQVVSRALEKEPDKRYQSAREMREAIKAALDHPESRPAAAGLPSALPTSPLTETAQGAETNIIPEAASRTSVNESSATQLGPPLELDRKSQGASETLQAAPAPAPPPSNRPADSPAPSHARRNFVLGVVSLVGVALILAGLARDRSPASESPGSPPAGLSSSSPELVVPSPVSAEPAPLPVQIEPAPGNAPYPSTGGPHSMELLIGKSRDEVSTALGQPAAQSVEEGQEMWLYGNGGQADCLVTFAASEDRVSIITLSGPNFTVMGEDGDGLGVGQSYDDILADLGEPGTRSQELLLYLDEGIAFSFENGLCTLVMLTAPSESQNW
jgi:serine/threonine-protein kinase